MQKKEELGELLLYFSSQTAIPINDLDKQGKQFDKLRSYLSAQSNVPNAKISKTIYIEDIPNENRDALLKQMHASALKIEFVRNLETHFQNYSPQTIKHYLETSLNIRDRFALTRILPRLMQNLILYIIISLREKQS